MMITVTLEVKSTVYGLEVVPCSVVSKVVEPRKVRNISVKQMPDLI